MWSGNPALNLIIPESTEEDKKFAISNCDFGKMWSAASKLFLGVQKSYFAKRYDTSRPDLRGVLVFHLVHCPDSTAQKELIFDDLCTMVSRHMDLGK